MHAFVIIFQQLTSTIRALKLIRNLKPDIVNAVTYSRLHPVIIGIRIFSRCPIVVDCRAYDLICPAHLSPNYLGKKKDFDEESQSHHGYRCVGYTSVSDPSFLSIRPFAVYESCMFNLYKYILRFLVNHFDGIKLVGVSNYVQRQLILNGFRVEKTTTIYNISEHIENRFSGRKSKVPTFAYGGRIEKDKGIWDIVAAAEILQRQLKEPFTINIAGTGGEFNNLQAYIKEKNLSCITLLGHITPGELAAHYGQSLAIIAASRWPEPFGRFILESMTARKPIIATRTGGTPEGIHDGVTGFLVDVGSAEQLATAMKYFIENPKRSHAMENAILEKQKLYEADVIGKQRLLLYESLLRNSV